MTKKTIKVLLPILLLLSAVSGCWDSLNVEDRDICTAVVVDKENDQFAFYVEVAGISSKIQNPKSGLEESQQHNTSIVKGRGKSYSEARDNLDRALNKPIYLGAVQSLILTERLAESGIEEYTLRVRQLTEYRKTMDVIITPDEPESFLRVQPANESAAGFAIEDTLATLNKLGMTFHFSLADLLQKLESKNPCYLLNTLSIREGQISLIGNTVFNKGQRLGFIPQEESHGIVFITARMHNKPRFDYVVNLDDKEFTLETTLRKRAVKVNYDGEKPTFELNMSFIAMGLYPSERIRITDDMRRKFEGMIKEQIENDVKKTIETSQKEYACDYLSFSEPFRISYPEAFAAMNWHDEFLNAEFNVNITVKEITNRTVDYEPEPVF